MLPEFQLPWVKLLPTILAFIAAAVDLWYERKKKNLNRWRRHGLPVIVIVTGIMSVWIVIRDSIESAEQRAEAAFERDVARRRESFLQKDADKWRQHEKLQLDRMESKMGDGEATERYLKLQRVLLQQLSSESTAAAAKAVFDNQERRAQLRDEVRRANDKLLESYKARFEPVLFLVQSKFDDWISEAKNRGIIWQLYSNTAPAVIIGPPRGWQTLRQATHNGKEASFQVYQAFVQDGRLDGQLNIVVYFNAEGLLQILLTEKSALVTNQKPSRFSFKSFQAEVDDPIGNREFTKTLTEGLDQVLSFAIIEGASH